MRYPTYSILFLLAVLFSACKDSGRHYLLTNNKAKFWDDVSHGGYCYKFTKDGNCSYYSYRKVNGQKVRRLFDYGDIVYPSTWQFKNDSCIEIQGFDYYFKFISDSLLKLTNIKHAEDTLILKPALDQQNP